MDSKQGELIVGTVNPTNRAGLRDPQLDDRLPSNVRHISLTMNFTQGTEEEFGASMPGYEAKVAELAQRNANLIRPSGAPPFMLLGYAGEQSIIRDWAQKYRVPMFTSGQNHVHALRALGIQKFIGASYFPKRMNDIFARYFTEAGFEVLSMEGIKAPFADVPKVPPTEIFEEIKRIFEQHRDAEAVYMLGSAWKTLDIIGPLENALGVPVIHPAPARNWLTQLHLGFRMPIAGYGKLLAEMPPLKN
jgi:maleate cis-trans isomerase